MYNFDRSDMSGDDYVFLADLFLIDDDNVLRF